MDEKEVLDLVYNLPHHVIFFNVLIFLDHEDIWNFRLVCKRFYDFYKNDQIYDTKKFIKTSMKNNWSAHIERLRNRLENGGWDFEDIVVTKRWGIQSFFMYYCCKIPSISEDDVFLLKIVQPGLRGDRGFTKYLVTQDSRRIKNHFNIVPHIFTGNRVSIGTDVLKHMIREDFEILREYFLKMRVKISFVIHYLGRDIEKPREIEYYANSHRNNSITISDRRICEFVVSALQGLHHLNKRDEESRSGPIIHRLLFTMIIDEEFRRAQLYDFALSIDLYNNKTGYLVDKDSLLMYHVEDGEMVFDKGGDEETNFPPEITNFDPSDPNTQFLDYSKCDIFSIGVIIYRTIFLLRTTTNNEEEVKFKKISPFSIDQKRKQENYIELENCHSSISRLVKRMLILDVNERIGHEEALEDWKKILNNEF